MRVLLSPADPWHTGGDAGSLWELGNFFFYSFPKELKTSLPMAGGLERDYLFKVFPSQIIRGFYDSKGKVGGGEGGAEGDYQVFLLMHDI